MHLQQPSVTHRLLQKGYIKLIVDRGTQEGLSNPGPLQIAIIFMYVKHETKISTLLKKIPVVLAKLLRITNGQI